MKKYLYLLPILFAIILVLFIMSKKRNLLNEKEAAPINDIPNKENQIVTKETTSEINPASKYCEENKGTLEIITNSDGSQFGLCKFEGYSCEEWAFYRGVCDIEEDAEKIKQKLIAKGLNLNGMKVVIHKHLGKYIAGGVVPVSIQAGGGYVFAVKENDEVKILADGNGSIMCSSFENYPDFPAFLVPECIDDTGNLITR